MAPPSEAEPRPKSQRFDVTAVSFKQYPLPSSFQIVIFLRKSRAHFDQPVSIKVVAPDGTVVSMRGVR